MSAHAGGMCGNQFKNWLPHLYSLFSSPARKKRMQASLLSHALRRDDPLRSNCRNKGIIYHHAVESESCPDRRFRTQHHKKGAANSPRLFSLLSFCSAGSGKPLPYSTGRFSVGVIHESPAHIVKRRTMRAVHERPLR